jgi:hypothetical protein
VVKYHGLARRYLMPSGFLMRPLLNGGTLGGRSTDMVRTDLTKSQRRRLAELAGLAYQRDLDAELAKLEAEFQKWRAGELSGHDLSDLIHAFHQGPSRDLFKAYDHRFREFAVANAIRRGVLTETEVGPEILALLAPNLSLLD